MRARAVGASSTITGVACIDPGQVADSVLAHSYAVLRVDAHDALSDAVSSARIAAHNFFGRTTSSLLPRHRGRGAGSAYRATTPSIPIRHLVRCRRVVDGLGLAGLNRPSDAKLLFRAWYRDDGTTGPDDDDGNEFTRWNRPRMCCHPQQPWPDREDDERCPLRESSHALAGMLHSLLTACLEEVTVRVRAERAGMAMFVIRDPDAGDKNGGREVCRSCCGNKRRRLSGGEPGEDQRGEVAEHGDKFPLDADGSSRHGTKEDGHIGNACAALDSCSLRTSSRSHSIVNRVRNQNCGNDEDTPSSSCAWCPLDYFLYRGGTAIGENCAEHVDRGALICVALTPDVPGLEVLPRVALTSQSKSSTSTSTSESMCKFVCPEEEERERLRRMGRADAGGFGSCVHDDVGGILLCIMAGDQLKRACGGDMEGEEDQEVEAEVANQRSSSHRLNACVHRVRKSLDGDRLSVTYELRLPLT